MKRMKVGWMALLAVLAGAVLIAPAMAAEPTDAEKKESDAGAPALMTQAELAQLLVKKLGLLNVIGKANPSAVESIDALTRYNIVPSMLLTPGAEAAGGWSLDPTALVQEQDLIVLLVRALGLADKVAEAGDAANIASWKKVLEDVQIPFQTPATAVAQMVPLTDIIAAIPVRASTPEPLTKVYIPSSEGLNLVDAIATGGTVKFLDLTQPVVGKPAPAPVPTTAVRPPVRLPVTPNTSKANSEV